MISDSVDYTSSKIDIVPNLRISFTFLGFSHLQHCISQYLHRFNNAVVTTYTTAHNYLKKKNRALIALILLYDCR